MCAVDAFYIEPYYPRVIRQEVRIPGLPKELDGLKIVHLSDLHIVKCGKREDRALASIARIRPDLICLTGDYIQDDGITPGRHTDEECFREAMRFISKLRARHGVYAILGNWDTSSMIPTLESAGIRVPGSEPITVRVNGADLRITSDTKPGTPSVPTIALIHIPDAADALSRPPGASPDLILAGHWHGGQVGRPLKMTDVKYLAGLFRVGRSQLYVTRGLGMHSIPVRFNCPSEITLIVLRT